MKWQLLSVCLVMSAPMISAQDVDLAELPVGRVVELKPLPERMWPRYFGVMPKPFLVDPQRVMNSRDFKERNDFLRYHSSDSKIDLWFYLFRENQEIPADAQADGIAQRFFNEGKPSVVVFYYMGQPQRASMLLSPSLAELVSMSDRERAMGAALEQAGKDAVVTKQFERFMLQMSIQLYWMEQLLGSEVLDEPVDEGLVSDVPQVVEKEASWMMHQRQWIQTYWVRLVFVVVLLSVAWFLRLWLIARASYQFPEIEVEPRLGGDHAAGVGAVISFASASVSPATQRDQTPDYLSRM